MRDKKVLILEGNYDCINNINLRLKGDLVLRRRSRRRLKFFLEKTTQRPFVANVIYDVDTNEVLVPKQHMGRLAHSFTALLRSIGYNGDTPKYKSF